MNSKTRILNTLQGNKVDRAPMWLRDEFNIEMPSEHFSVGFIYKYEGGSYKTIGTGLEFDEFTDSWVIKDKNYIQVKKFHREVGGDIIRECKIPGNVCNRLLLIPPSRIKVKNVELKNNIKTVEYEISTPKGTLYTILQFERDMSTLWTIKDLVETREDIHKVLSIPYHLEEMDFTLYHSAKKRLRSKGITLIQVDTPMITVSGMMKFEDFLILTIQDQGLLRELCDIAYERIDDILDVCFQNNMGPIFRINGSEQSTPPMNSPKIYEEFIYNYEKRMIEKIHKHGCFAAVHCHGNIKGVLPLMLDMQVDLLDPVEAPPNGDIEFDQAKEIVDGKMTLAGNIQLNGLENLNGKKIDDEVKKIFTLGRKDHVILTTTASPITYMSDTLRDNYITMLKAGMQYGTF